MALVRAGPFFTIRGSWLRIAKRSLAAVAGFRGAQSLCRCCNGLVEGVARRLMAAKVAPLLAKTA